MVLFFVFMFVSIFLLMLVFKYNLKTIDLCIPLNFVILHLITHTRYFFKTGKEYENFCRLLIFFVNFLKNCNLFF